MGTPSSPAPTPVSPLNPGTPTPPSPTPGTPTTLSPTPLSPISAPTSSACGCGPADGQNQPECVGKPQNICKQMNKNEGKCKWTECSQRANSGSIKQYKLYVQTLMFLSRKFSYTLHKNSFLYILFSQS